MHSGLESTVTAKWRDRDTADKRKGLYGSQ